MFDFFKKICKIMICFLFHPNSLSRTYEYKKHYWIDDESSLRVEYETICPQCNRKVSKTLTWEKCEDSDELTKETSSELLSIAKNYKGLTNEDF